MSHFRQVLRILDATGPDRGSPASPITSEVLKREKEFNPNGLRCLDLRSGVGQTRTPSRKERVDNAWRHSYQPLHTYKFIIAECCKQSGENLNVYFTILSFIVEEIVSSDVKISCILSTGEFSHTLEYELTSAVFFCFSQISFCSDRTKQRYKNRIGCKKSRSATASAKKAI